MKTKIVSVGNTGISCYKDDRMSVLLARDVDTNLGF